MNRMEFEQLRDLPDKVIQADIEFKKEPQVDPNLVFDKISVENSLDWDVQLNGTYKPDIPSVTYNFVVRGVGPVCRVEVNGKVHRPAGRTHKHDLRDEDSPRRNMPDAVERPDLEGRTARQVWDILCRQANIRHTGRFVDPEGAS